MSLKLAKAAITLGIPYVYVVCIQNQMQLQTSVPEKGECVCETLVLYLTKLFFTGWKQKPEYMSPVPCVHLNVHIVDIKEVLCGSGIGVILSWTYVEFTRKRGDCDDIRTFAKGEIICESAIYDSLHQVKV